jgi:hypothetical protein
MKWKNMENKKCFKPPTSKCGQLTQVLIMAHVRVQTFER